MGAKAGAHAIAGEVDAEKGMLDRPQRLQRALAADAGQADAGEGVLEFGPAEAGLLGGRPEGARDRGPCGFDAKPRRRRSGQALAEHRAAFVLDAGAAAGAAAVDAEIEMRRGAHSRNRSIVAPHMRSLRSRLS